MRFRSDDDDKQMYGEQVYGEARVSLPPGAPAGDTRSLGRVIGIAIFAGLIAVAAGTGYVSATSTASWFPAKWDPRIQPIADEVARLRGLNFVHPVAVRYLAPKDFEKKVGVSDGISAAGRAEARREEAVFRSLGFIGGKVDLLKGIDTAQTSGTLAYYDPAEEDIIVRGTTLDVAHRVTIAHELTHVLQDQHFDLPKLQKRAADSDTGDLSSLKALIEGDAVRIQQDYLKKLSAADKSEYDRENSVVGARVKKETTSVPEIVSLLSDAPYELGPSTIRVLVAGGGNQAVNDALTGPTPSSGVFIQTGLVEPAVAVSSPLPPADGTVVGKSEIFGPFEMFLTLATRIDPGRALQAADVVDGGRALTFRSNGVTCYRVSVNPASATSRPLLLGAVNEWANRRARTTVDTSGDLVGFTACDPGKAAPDPKSAQLGTAAELLFVRTALTVEVAKGPMTGPQARCVAREFVAAPGAQALVLGVGSGKPSPEQATQLQQLSAASAIACLRDTSAGLG